MYREKLLSQIIFLEELQRSSSIIDVSEVLELGKNILSIAKKIDELDETVETTVATNINGETVYEIVTDMNDSYKHNHGETNF